MSLLTLTATVTIVAISAMIAGAASVAVFQICSIQFPRRTRAARLGDARSSFPVSKIGILSLPSRLPEKINFRIDVRRLLKQLADGEAGSQCWGLLPAEIRSRNRACHERRAPSGLTNGLHDVGDVSSAQAQEVKQVLRLSNCARAAVTTPVKDLSKNQDSISSCGDINQLHPTAGGRGCDRRTDSRPDPQQELAQCSGRTAWFRRPGRKPTGRG